MLKQHWRSEYPWTVSETVYKNIVKAGDKVIVIGGRSADRLKNQRLEFIRHDVNMQTGREWLVLWGGKGTHLGWQYVRPWHVKKV